MKFGLFSILCCVSTSFELFVKSENIPIEVNNQESKLEHLDLKDLVKLALDSADGYQKANEFYKMEYGDILVIITDDAGYVLNFRHIHINYDLIEKFLKAFGGSIKRLHIKYRSIPRDKQNFVTKLVSSYCSKTLLEFNARSCKNGAFNGIKTPFEMVNRVYFFCEWSESGQNSLPFNELFPKVRILLLNYPGDDIYNYHYTDLMKLFVYKNASNNFIRIIKNNPQIQHLILKENSMDVIKTVSETLHELKILDIEIPSDLESYKGPAIQFEKIEEVSITSNDCKIDANKIKLKNIDSLKLYLSGNVEDEYAEFIGGITALKSLFIFDGSFSKSTFSKLSQKLSTLSEVDIVFDSSVDADDIWKFVQNNKKINNVHFDCSGSEEFLQDMRSKFGKEWKIDTENDEYSRFEMIKLKQSQISNDVTTTETQNITTDDVIGETINIDNNASNLCSSTIITVLILAFNINVFAF